MKYSLKLFHRAFSTPIFDVGQGGYFPGEKVMINIWTGNDLFDERRSGDRCWQSTSYGQQ